MILKAKKTEFNKYIFTDGDNEVFYGIRKVKRLQQIKELYSSQNNHLIAQIKTRVKFFFKISFQISFPTEENKDFTIYHRSFRKPLFECKYNSIDYSIIPHKGLKTSIFTKENQVAYFQKSKTNIAFKDYIKIIADNDADTILLALIVLAISGDFENNHSSINMNIGNIGGELKPFDVNWASS